jgi:hypothetical protein
MQRSIKKSRLHEDGRVVVPLLLWWAGLPFALVFLLWLFFFRG